MFALNFMAVRKGLKFSLSPFLIHIKPKGEKGGSWGGEPDFSRRENVPLFGLRAERGKPKFVLRRVSHGFSPPDDKKQKIQTKSRDSKYFKLHLLAVSTLYFRYLFPPTALKLDRTALPCV